MPENNQILSIGNQLVGMPLAGPESFSQEQIAYLKRAMGIDETVLWENASGTSMHNGVTLSESRLNFERLRLTVSCQANTPMGYIDIPMSGVNAGSSFQFYVDMPFNNETGATYALTWKVIVSATNTTLTSTTALYWGKMNFNGSSSGTWTQGENVQIPYIYKVVGIHRIAGGN